MAEKNGHDGSLRARLERALLTSQDEDRESVESATLRLILCAVDDRDVLARERGECAGCPEEAMLRLLETMTEQREVSAKEYDQAGRIEEAERERSEMDVIKSFLPKKLKGKVLEVAVEEVIEELEATKLKDMGRCMQMLKSRFPEQIDTATAGKAVRKALS